MNQTQHFSEVDYKHKICSKNNDDLGEIYVQMNLYMDKFKLQVSTTQKNKIQMDIIKSRLNQKMYKKSLFFYFMNLKIRICKTIIHPTSLFCTDKNDELG